MPPVALPTPVKVSTPGCYKLNKKRKKKLSKTEKGKKESEKEREKKKQKKRKSKRGRPSYSTKKSSARKNNYRTRYTAADMERAVDMVQREEYAVARAAEMCGVPRVTLIDRLKGTHKTVMVGRPKVLSEAEEQGLVKVLVQMAEYNYPVTRRHLVDMVKDYLDKTRHTRFNQNKPGRMWFKAFMERHKDQVTIRKATNIKRSRAAVSPAVIKDYHANLSVELKGIPASHIFNCDESCMQDDPGEQKCIFQKGVRYPEQVGV